MPPYGLAEHIIVTADSVNMVGEACTSGAPVQVFELAGGNRKFRTFHGDMQAAASPPVRGKLDARLSNRPMRRRKSRPPCNRHGTSNALFALKNQKPLNKSASHQRVLLGWPESALH